MVKPKWRIPMKVAAIGCYLFFMWYDNTHSGFGTFDQLFDSIALNELKWIS